MERFIFLIFQKLDLSRCNCLFMSGILLAKPEDQAKIAASFKHLTSLNLAGIRYLSDALLNRLVAVAPNLQHLSLASCNIAYEVELYSTESNRAGSVNFLTLSNLLSILKERAALIKSLDLSQTSLSSNGLKSITNVPELRLERIFLRKCNNLGNDGIVALACKQSALRVLDASGCRDLSDGALIAICDNLGKLEALDIHDWVKVGS